MTAFTLFFSALALGGCAADTDSSPSDPEVADLSAGGPVGKFELKPAANAQLKAGDLFQLNIWKYQNSYNFTVQVVSKQCGFGRPGATCPASWVLGDDRSLDRYEGSLVLNESARSMKVEYTVLDRESGEESEVSRTFKYSKLSTALKLTEGSTTATLNKVPAASSGGPDATTMEALDEFITESGIDFAELPTPPRKQTPMAVRREAHFYDQVWGGDYPALITLLTFKNVDYYVVVEDNDGGGSREFFTKEGVWFNSLSATESSDWSWSRDWN
jgi:hypothetical protein